MKKIFFSLVMLSAVVFTSCGSDDDAAPTLDPIIGSWELSARVDIENGTETPDDLGCELNEPLTFNLDGTFEGKDFDRNSQGACEEVDSVGGTWKNIGSGTYTFNGVQQVKITFGLNNFVLEAESEGIITQSTYTKK